MKEQWHVTVRPIGIPECWTILLHGDTDNDRRLDLYNYMLDMNVMHFEVNHYDKVKTNIAIEDITLN